MSDFSPLKLERATLLNKDANMSQLVAHDWARHRRILQPGVAIGFPLGGTFDPSLYGLYYIRVKLGTPPQEFHIQVDIGSDVVWINCNGCSGCPTTGSSIQDFDLNFFDPSRSSTVQAIPCSDKICKSEARMTSEARCDKSANQCSYELKYEDGSRTEGRYFKDLMQLDAISNGSATPNTSHGAALVFGCSTIQAGHFATMDRPIDGVLGLGQQPMSLLAQLSSERMIPPIFSHCLSGDSSGGVLVFGEILDPAMVYTPLVPNQIRYNVYMESISVNGQVLPIDPSTFAISRDTAGTIIDSGTTLSYLPEAAYALFINAINGAISESVHLVSTKEQCYRTSSSIDQSFPRVSLSFKGGVSMLLEPQDYLYLQPFPVVKLVEFKGRPLTILGDIILKNKAVVYDLSRQRIGWANYDCSRSVNVRVDMNATNPFISRGQILSPGINPNLYLISTLLLLLLIHNI